MKELKELLHFLYEDFSINDKNKIDRWNINKPETLKDFFNVVKNDVLEPEVKGQKFYFSLLYKIIVLTCKHGNMILYPSEFEGTYINNETWVPLVNITKENLKETIRNSENGKIVLSSDIEWGKEDGLLPESKASSTTIDLGNNTLHAVECASAEAHNKYIVSNGKIDYQYSLYNAFLFSAERNGTVVIENCNVESNAMIASPYGKNSTVIIRNCTINCDVFAVGTTAIVKEDSGNATIIIENSTITMKSADSCAVLFNIPGKLIIKNSKIIGNRQGLILRSGMAEISNSEIITTGKYTNDNQYVESSWATGNEVPMAALVIGNHYDGAFQNSAKCTLKNCKIKAEGNASRAIYIYSNNSYKNRAVLHYDKLTEFTGKIVSGGNYTYIN